ncbi:hypothetical protein [Haloferula sargassicola]|uniref:NusG domain-containing protein n=1 Tax=Haloferula sargassicola TaxID=490096 RepID=A0ABP9UST0_9BACT
MKHRIPPIVLACLTLVFALPAAAQRASWSSLAQIDDELILREGETAFVVSVSKPIYLSIEPKDRICRGIRLRPQRHATLVERPGTTYYERNEIVEVGWHQPFPIAGPCKIRLGTPALVTMQVVSPPKPEPPQPAPGFIRRFR